MPLPAAPPAAPPPAVLRHGQAVSRAEFYRAAEADPDRYRNAERIDGKLFMNPASVRREHHSRPCAVINGLLFDYYVRTPGTEVVDNGTAQSEDDHDPQPDAYLLVLPECGGQTTFTDDDYIRGAPELIVEIAGSSLSKYLGRIKDVYEADGCREYLVWATERGRFYCFRNGPDGFAEADPAEGVFCSETFPGLWLDLAAVLEGDYLEAVETLRGGIESPEHAAFVSELSKRRGVS